MMAAARAMVRIGQADPVGSCQEAQAVAITEPRLSEATDLSTGALPVQMEPIVRAIEARVDSVPRWEIERIVMEELLRFTNATVVQYIPILVERAVLVRLPPQPAVTGGPET